MFHILLVLPEMENSAAHFNGDAQILIPHDPMWNTTEYTLSIGYKWELNPSATPNGNSLIMSKRPSSGWGSGFEHSPEGSLSWSIDGNGGAGIGISLPQQEWIQVTWVFAVDSIKFYFNSELVNTVSSPGAMNFNNLPISIGMRGNGWHELIGDIDYVGYWSRPLSSEEVDHLQSMTAPQPGCTDTTACNFDSEATSEDGSCIYPPSDSVDCEFGGNYCGEGTSWDASLQACVGFDDCPADLNGNGLVEVSDLLMVLADFGTECAPPVSEFTCGDPVSYHGYDYATVQIGEQCWLAENLRTELYSNGDEVPNLPQGADWQAATNDGSGAWVYFSNNPDSGETFGKLYNWYVTVDERGICPTSWHVPENAEWSVLVDHYGGAEIAAIELKGNYSDEWFGNGTSGFNALPGGFRDWGNSVFFLQGTSGDWWTSSNQGAGFWRGMDSNSNNVHNALYGRAMGNSIRCLKD